MDLDTGVGHDRRQQPATETKLDAVDDHRLAGVLTREVARVIEPRFPQLSYV